MSASSAQNIAQDASNNLAGALREDQLAEKDDQRSIAELLLSGQYTYLTYLMMSTTCFFFWLSPNCHKFKSILSGNDLRKEQFYREQFRQRLAAQKVMTRHQAKKL